MLNKELIKIAGAAAVGLIVALFLIGSVGWGVLIISPLYCVGLLYGAETIFPWLGKTFLSLSKMMLLSIVMKSLLGFLVLVIVLPVALLILLVVGWLVGLVKMIQLLSDAVRMESSFSAQRKRLHRGGGEQSGRRAAGERAYPEDEDYAWGDPADDEWEASLPENSSDDDDYFS